MFAGLPIALTRATSTGPLLGPENEMDNGMDFITSNYLGKCVRGTLFALLEYVSFIFICFAPCFKQLFANREG